MEGCADISDVNAWVAAACWAAAAAVCRVANSTSMAWALCAASACWVVIACSTTAACHAMNPISVAGTLAWGTGRGLTLLPRRQGPVVLWLSQQWVNPLGTCLGPQIGVSWPTLELADRAPAGCNTAPPGERRNRRMGYLANRQGTPGHQKMFAFPTALTAC